MISNGPTKLIRERRERRERRGEESGVAGSSIGHQVSRLGSVSVFLHTFLPSLRV